MDLHGLRKYRLGIAVICWTVKTAGNVCVSTSFELVCLVVHHLPSRRKH